MFLLMKLLLPAILFFNLGTAFGTKKQVEENTPQAASKKWYLENTTISTQTPTNYSDPNNYQQISIEPEFNPDTEIYTDLTTDEQQIYNKNDTEDDFYTEIESNKPLINEIKNTSQEETFQFKKLPILTNTTTNLTNPNYNKETLPKCPKGLIYSAEREFCYFITEPTSYPPKCPYQATLEYYYIYILPEPNFEITNQPYWVFTKRNTTVVNKTNCFVTNGTEKNSIPTNCTNLYPGVCVYDVSFKKEVHPTPSFTDYCQRRYNMSCVADDIISPKTCYCRIEAKENKPSRNRFCKKLVEIEDPYQNNFLIKLLGLHKSCWIGLKKFEESYQWVYSNKTSNYTFWANNTDFGKPYGALGKEGWILEEDGILTCAICEISTENHPPAHLQLKYNKTNLNLEITNPMELFEEVKCFARNSEEYQSINLQFIKDKFVVLPLEFEFTISGYYWCTAPQIPDLTPIYSNTIFIPIKYGHEYGLTITSPQPNASLPESFAKIRCDNIKHYFYGMALDSKLINILRQNKENIEILCHINLNSTDMSKAKGLDLISNRFKIYNLTITNLTSIEVCLPSNTTSGNQTLNWPETPIGVIAIPEELCLQENGFPVTRTCSANFYDGAQWLDVNGTCANVVYPETTQTLNNLLNTLPNNLSEEILNITESTNNFTNFEIHLISKVLEKMAIFREQVKVSDVTKIINNIMKLEPNQLSFAQESLNSTDLILYSLDEILAQTQVGENGFVSEVTENLVVQINNINKTNVNGIKLGQTQNGFDSTKINPLEYGTSQEDLFGENFEVAVLLPEDLQTDIKNCMGEKATPNLITTVFFDDVLFNQQNHSNHPDSRIIGITIPDFNCTFRTPLKIIFNASTKNNTRLKCASWLYGFNDLMESTHGEWFMEDTPKSLGNYQVCEFNHITHFTLLILGGTDEISEGHKKALDIITAVGSGLSILGLLMVFITAIKFKSFRSANAVVINFSIAMTAQIILLFIADNIAENKVMCAVFGVALHYIVLVQFSWMLTIAVLQYRRYVVVFASPTPYLVLKLCACSWGIPLIPIIIIISISRESYGENSHGLCYALGNYFIFGVLIPVSLIIFINLIVFLRIMLSIAASRKITVHQGKKDTSSLQLRLAIMLYFLLGLTWGFGLCAAIGGGIVYSYLFCITATLQGFILFLYFIVLNEKTRSLWTDMKKCHCKGKSDEYEVNTESATAMMRRPKHTASSDTNTSSTTSEMLRKFKNRSSSDF